MNLYSNLVGSIILILLLHDDSTVEARRGGGFRGGGGSKSSGAGRSSSSGSAYGLKNPVRSGSRAGYGNGYGGGGVGYGGRYSGGSGPRWSSFGTGLVAYGIMSSLASRGAYRNNYYYRNSHYRSSSPSTMLGDETLSSNETLYLTLSSSKLSNVCINNEDFNGTQFGVFECPLPEFDPSAKYCCGSFDNQTQYCCAFFDDESRKMSVILIIATGLGAVLCIGVCCVKLIKRRERSKKYNQRNGSGMPGNIHNVNRNIYMRPGGSYPQQPGMNHPSAPLPPMNYMNRPHVEGQPLLFPSQQQQTNSSSNVTYKMPQPQEVQMPPSYTEALQKH